MTDRVWAAAGIFAALIAVIWSVGWWAGVFTRPLWLPRWRCVDGFWHWRKECDGHDLQALRSGHSDDWPGLEARWEDPDPMVPENGRLLRVAVEGGSTGLDGNEAALDEAWVAELHTINADLHTPGNDVLGLAHMSWRDAGLVDVWDWGRRMDAANDAWHVKWTAELESYDWGLAA